LVANTAFLEWRLGERAKPALFATIRDQLSSAGPQLPLALMLADIGKSFDLIPELRGLYEALGETHANDELLPLAIRIHLYEGELDRAAQEAIRHADSNPLDLDAVRAGVILQGQIFGQYGEAADKGIAALRRFPCDSVLKNNIAYCLALAGRAVEADQVLRNLALDDPIVIATRGLVDLALGRVEEGLQRYDEAEASVSDQSMRSEEADDFRRLLRAFESLAVRELGLSARDGVPEEFLSLPVHDDWETDRRYLVLRRILERASHQRSGDGQ
jgi:tetratricopeptide (TPR) repeat protein